MQSKAKTVNEYIASLPPDRRKAIQTVREVILKHVPKGYVEWMDFGMIVYVIPLSRYPNTYNGHPLGIVALASQKNYMSVYLMCLYGDTKVLKKFKEAWKKSGKKLDMGKSCIRFKKIEDIELGLIGKHVEEVSVEDYIKIYEQSIKKA